MTLFRCALLPYLERSNILAGGDFDQVQRQFGGAGFLTFASWFN